jgi:hypothetical protein
MLVKVGRTRNTELRLSTRNTERRTLNAEPTIGRQARNTEHGTRNTEHRTRNIYTELRCPECYTERVEVHSRRVEVQNTEPTIGRQAPNTKHGTRNKKHETLNPNVMARRVRRSHLLTDCHALQDLFR